MRKRRCVLLGGDAFIFEKEMISIIIRKYREELNRCLAKMRLEKDELQEDYRLIPRLANAHHEHVTKRDLAERQAAMDGGRPVVTPDMINDLAAAHFPPCMRSIHENLRKHHHLKHYGRLHYGLFLKAIGLSMDDAIEFFQSEFLKGGVITAEKFSKEYAYNIRYNYGKVIALIAAAI